MAETAPIALFIYNRPEHTARTLSSLSANSLAAKSDLVIYADGPKTAEHERSVHAARAVARNASGFKSIRMVERDRNLGLAGSIIEGVTELCETRGRAVVIEDDLVLSPNFLAFMNAGLDRYKDDERVMQVSGYMFPDVCDGNDVRFLPLTTTWGWGVWQRAWRHLDRDLSGLERLKADMQLRNRFDLNGAYQYFSMAQRQKLGQVDSWGIAWYLSVFIRGGLVLYPSRSLVMNIGIDGSGVHGRGAPALQRLIVDQFNAGNLALPDQPEIDFGALASIELLLRSMSPGLIARMRERAALYLRQSRILGHK